MKGEIVFGPWDKRWQRGWRRVRETLLRRMRMVLWLAAVGGLGGFAISQMVPKTYRAIAGVQVDPKLLAFTPSDAKADAKRDIKRGEIRFYWNGGIVPNAPGIPPRYSHLLGQYPRAVAGTDLGCMGSSERQREYARRYNQAIIEHLTAQ